MASHPKNTEKVRDNTNWELMELYLSVTLKIFDNKQETIIYFVKHRTRI